jgi:hypothetical protein
MIDSAKHLRDSRHGMKVGGHKPSRRTSIDVTPLNLRLQARFRRRAHSVGALCVPLYSASADEGASDSSDLAAAS